MRSQMLDEMEHSTWLDDDSRESAMVKLHALKWYIGNPNYFSKKDFLERLYDGVSYIFFFLSFNSIAVNYIECLFVFFF